MTAATTSIDHFEAGIKKGRGKAQRTMDLIAAAIEILREKQPASVRAVCYQLFIAGRIASMAKNETNAVSRHLVWAREQGMLPWEWLVDETREAETIASWSDPESIIKQAVKQYRKDYWESQPNRVEVWSEKGTVRGTLGPVLQKYGVTFRVMHGYGSATALHDIAEESTDSDKPFFALYVGDWDPSGLHMSEVDLPGRIERYEGEIDITRIALEKGDLDPLPHFDLEDKVKDPRYRWFAERYGSRCWELDAMSPVDLRNRVESVILGLLDKDAWDHAVKIEAAERESMRTVLTTWKSISMQALKKSDGEAAR
ncbi:MAG: hypothetical protein KGL43_26000 [Burkholderiales bacterium]|nr:hypothetical protein [Burkholderiales bacterium]